MSFWSSAGQLMISSANLAELLTTVSWAAQSMSQDPRQVATATRLLLGSLRRATGMDAAELYLADPPQTYLVRIGHSGPDSEAFSQRSIFGFGEGFPGLTAQTRQPLTTTHLEDEGRYLRGRVKALGYQTFLSYPLLTPHAVVGVLNLAAKDSGQVAAAQQALELIAPLLASNLYSVMTSLGERTLHRVRRASTGRERALALLEDHLQASSALRAALRPLEGPTIETHPGTMPPCAAFGKCPALEGKVCVSGMPDLSCTAMSDEPHMICLPLWNGEGVDGTVSVQFSSRGMLGTEALAPLLWLGRLATPGLGLTQTSAAAEEVPWLEIQTFGAFRVKRNGQILAPADFKRRQAYQLLKLLTTRWGRPIQMSELCEAFWPDEDTEERVMARLHVVLNALRQVLEPTAEQRGKVLVRDGTSYSFAPTLPWRLDAAEFETLIHQGDAQTGETALTSYAQALRLYRGDYLEDDPYAEQFALERDYLRELAVHALFRSAELHEAAGRLQDTLASYAHILTIDPLHFDAHEAVITFLVTQGRLEEAQTRWERYAQAYGSVPPLASPTQRSV